MVGGSKYNNSIHLASGKSYELYVPLEFWFCRNVGLALPLIALQYHEVKINLQFETAEKCISAASGAATAFTSASLWVDYVYLDTDERRRFAQLSHEYLIEQLQFTGQEAVNNAAIKPKLNFNHPTKELVWFVSNTSATNNNWMNYTTKAITTPISATTPLATAELLRTQLKNTAVDSTNTIDSAKLVLNGNDRFAERPGSYFNLIQPYQHHENIPYNAGINVYSFALKPEDHQPSGSLNMSRIDTAVLNLTVDSTYYGANTSSLNLYVYAINYNVLRILSGMGGLAYSN